MVLAEVGEVVLGPLCIRRRSTPTSRYSTDVVPCRCITTIGPTGEDLEKFVAAVDRGCGEVVRLYSVDCPYNRLGTTYSADVVKKAINYCLGEIEKYANHRG